MLREGEGAWGWKGMLDQWRGAETRRVLGGCLGLGSSFSQGQVGTSPQSKIRG